MNARLLLVPVAVGVLLVSTVGAGAATPTLDGKKVKKLTATYHPAAQSHDSDQFTSLVGLADDDRVNCTGDACGRLTFLYQPAKGVKGGVFFHTSWTIPVTDIDLYVAELDKHGFATDVAHCGGFGGTAESVYVPAGELKPGKRYVVVTSFYRTPPGETVTTTASFPSADKTPKTAPSQTDALSVNCAMG